MDKRIIYKTDDGGVSVIIPTVGSGLTIEEVAAKDVPAGVEWTIIDAGNLPKDRQFRNAWKLEAKQIKEDIAEARNIANRKRRQRRSAEFAPLDVEATIPDRAQQAEKKRSKIRAKYETLQKDIDAATDTNQLRVVMRGILDAS